MFCGIISETNKRKAVGKHFIKGLTKNLLSAEHDETSIETSIDYENTNYFSPEPEDEYPQPSTEFGGNYQSNLVILFIDPVLLR